MIKKDLLLICAAGLVVLAYFSSLTGQELSGWVLYFFILAFILFKPKFNPFILKLITFAGIFLALRYWFFRTFVTMSFAEVKSFLLAMPLYLAETLSIILFITTALINLRVSKHTPKPINKHPQITVFVPTYSEPVDLVKTTLIACSQLQYPQDKIKIYLLDDGATLQKLNNGDDTSRLLARKRYHDFKHICAALNITYLTRTKNEFAKAGNINNAFSSQSFSTVEFEGQKAAAGPAVNVKGDILLVLDCDHIPASDFLQKTVGFFEDKDLFMVQTPHFFANPNAMEKNLRLTNNYPGENDMFYFRVLRGLDYNGSAFFCGSAALLSCDKIKQIGGFSGNTITEDTATSLALHAKGYKSMFYDRPLVCGLAAETIDGFLIQRMRWAQGSIQIMILKKILLREGLSLKQKICYTASFSYWFFGLTQLVYFVTPMLFLFWGFKVYNASLWQIFMFSIPYFFGTLLISNYNFGKYRLSFYNQVLEMLQGIYIAIAVVSTFISPRKPKFKVTPKNVPLDSNYISPHIKTFLIMLAINIAALISGILLYDKMRITEAFVIVGFWFFYNWLILFVCLGAMFERKGNEETDYFPTAQQAAVDAEGKEYRVTLQKLSKEGFIFTAPVLPAAKKAVLSAKNSLGKTYKLPVILEGNKASFVNRDLDDLKEIISFVYGDSQRWVDINSLRCQKQRGILHSMYILLKLGAGAVKDMSKHIMGKL